jgi:hypothetical protein
MCEIIHMYSFSEHPSSNLQYVVKITQCFYSASDLSQIIPIPYQLWMSFTPILLMIKRNHDNNRMNRHMCHKTLFLVRSPQTQYLHGWIITLKHYKFKMIKSYKVSNTKKKSLSGKCFNPHSIYTFI